MVVWGDRRRRIPVSHWNVGDMACSSIGPTFIRREKECVLRVSLFDLVVIIQYRYLTSCYSFPYVDTLKVLEKWGPGAHFFGHGSDADIDALERLLASPDDPRDLLPNGNHQSPSSSILALFCEFPSNPLLRSPNLKRLRALADEHNFLIVVDETVGSFVNVHVLPDVDMIATSLTKIFSGDTNVMGGG